ncbi:MAG: hypothetical protein BWY63_01966 [Chloroflexi bacterium ADurb.Bin360]|nr:MAG: hypothetical protein BWY63_01966 [Chloroflexi bacterium ADurb.Bin360]
MTNDDPHDLNRFINAQEGVYERALAELKSGQKRSHWMWFIFPQVEGLGQSPTSQYFAIKSVAEARAYLAHPLLGARLRESAEAVLALKGRSASEVFGFPDDLKFRSCMTLFAEIAGADSIFAYVLQKVFNDQRDRQTLEFLTRGR